MKWEYIIVQLPDQISDIEPWLNNNFGNEGWELVAISGTALFFKRPKGIRIVNLGLKR